MIGKVGFRSVLILLGVIGLAAATALGSPGAIGSLVGSKNATLDGQVPLPYTTVLNGDTLQVNNGLAMVSLNHGGRMMLGSNTEASFSRQPDGVTVSLNRGNVSLYHAQQGTGFKVKVGDVTVAPARGYRTIGEVAMADGLLLVTAKNGALKVEKAGTAEEVSEGKTITISTTADRAPTPVPPGNLHIKHIISGKDLIYLGVGAEVAGATIAVVELTRSSATVSTVTPTP